MFIHKSQPTNQAQIQEQELLAATAVYNSKSAITQMHINSTSEWKLKLINQSDRRLSLEANTNNKTLKIKNQKTNVER